MIKITFLTDLKDRTYEEAREYARDDQYLRKFCDLLNFSEVLQNKISIREIEDYVIKAFEYYYCRYYSKTTQSYSNEHAFRLIHFDEYLESRYPQYKNDMHWSNTGSGNWQHDRQLLRNMVGLDWL